MTSTAGLVFVDDVIGLFASALLYVVAYLAFVHILKYPRNWMRISTGSLMSMTISTCALLMQVSLVVDGFDPRVFGAAFVFLSILFFLVAAPALAFKPASWAIEVCARHGDYICLVMLLPAACLAYVFPDASRLHGLLAAAIVIEMSWFLRRLQADRGRQLVPIQEQDMAVMNLQANNDLLGFAKRHGISELVFAGSTASWLGCAKTSSPCPFNLYVNRLGFNTAPCCREHMQTLGHTLSGWLEEMGLSYWLEGGTLLGAVRENGALLAWEDDVDVSVLLEADVAWSALASGIEARAKRDGFFVDYFEETGFIAISNAEPSATPFRWENYRLRGEVRLDLAVYRRGMSRGEEVLERRSYKGAMPTTESGGYGIPSDLVLPTTNITFMGRECACPRRAADYLRVLYGDFNTIAYSYVDAKAAENRRHLDEM